MNKTEGKCEKKTNISSSYSLFLFSTKTCFITDSTKHGEFGDTNTAKAAEFAIHFISSSNMFRFIDHSKVMTHKETKKSIDCPFPTWMVHAMQKVLIIHIYVYNCEYW